MIEFEIHPREGIGPVHFGMSRETVRELMQSHGLPPTYFTDTLDWFAESAFQVEYEEGTVTFIGVSNGPFRCLFKGRDVFDMPASEVFALANEGEPARFDGPARFDAYEYLFVDQVLTVSDADTQYDEKGGYSRQVYAQVGAGDERYLAAVRRLSR